MKNLYLTSVGHCGRPPYTVMATYADDDAAISAALDRAESDPSITMQIIDCMETANTMRSVATVYDVPVARDPERSEHHVGPHS